MTSRQSERFRRVPVPTVPNLALRLPVQIPLDWALDSLVPFPADWAIGF